MKAHVVYPFRGWLPQEPYIPSHLRINSLKSRHKSKLKTTVGLALLLFGVGAILLSFATIQKTDEIFNSSFSLNSNQQDTPFFVSYNSNTQNPYATQPILKGEVTVNGENVAFTVQETKTVVFNEVFNGKAVKYSAASQDPKDTYQVISTTVGDEYSFNLPINTYYQFTFENPSSQYASVNFSLKATWTDTTILIPGLIVLLAAAFPGTVLIVIGARGAVTQKRTVLV
jgi:hypothetical protein